MAKSGKKIGLKSVKIGTSPVATRTKALADKAREIRKKLPADAKEDQEKLDAFIKILDDVRLSLAEACQTISSGNPMFETFKIRKK